MGINKSAVAAAGLLIFCCLVVHAQDKEYKPTIGIRVFENPYNYCDPHIGVALADLFTTELMKTGKYRIVEREALDELIDEMQLSQSSYGDKDTAPQQGHFRGLDYLFIASITNFGEKGRTIGTGGFGYGVAFLPVPYIGMLSPFIGMLGLRRDEAYVRLDFRIVDATTREVVYSGYGNGKDKTSGISLAGSASGVGGNFNFNERSFLQSRLGRAALKAISDTIKSMDHETLRSYISGKAALYAKEKEEQERALQELSGRILAVGGNEAVIVDLGTDQGLRVGDNLDVWKEENITDSKGNVVYTEQQQVGTLTVTEVKADRSKAEHSDGSGFEEGYIVRKH